MCPLYEYTNIRRIYEYIRLLVYSAFFASFDRVSVREVCIIFLGRSRSRRFLLLFFFSIASVAARPRTTNSLVSGHAVKRLPAITLIFFFFLSVCIIACGGHAKDVEYTRI